MASDGSDIHVLLRAGGGIPARGFDWDNVQFDPYRMGLYVDLKYGKALREGERNAGQVPVYGTNGRCGWHDASLSDGPGVILGRKGQGHLGVKWEPGPFWVIDTAYYAAVDPAEIDLKWLYYTCQYIGLDHLKSGEKPGLSRDVFRAQILPKPIRREQEAIARILGALDDKIELNRRMNCTLEALAQKLFKSWFVDFEPVLAKSQNRKPFGLSDEITALFPDAFEDSELGPVPKGWRVSAIGSETAVVGGSTPSTDNAAYWNDGTHCWVTPRDLSRLSDPVLLDTERKITDAGVERISSGLLPIGTVLLSSRAPIGYVVIAGVPTAVNQGFIAIKCDGGLPNQFVRHWVVENMDEVEARAGGTTFAEISKAAFRPIPVVVPSDRVLDEFQKQSALLFERVVQNVKQSRALAALRDLLLPKLLSGEIRVPMADPEAESVFKDAAS